jgi:N-acylneuraminate cytidylyltransferase
MNNIAVIPARGGSKRIPRKNIRDFQGKPIIAYSIKAALESDIFNEVMVSTDDEEIADISMKFGASVPFYRSAELSSDMAMTAPVLIEVLQEYINRGITYENICCIYPCAPFVTSARLKEGMELLSSSRADGVVPVVKFSYPPQRCLVIRDSILNMLWPENYNKRSQDLEPIYHDVGQFYCLKVNSLLEQQSLFCKQSLPMILSENEVQDIDTEEDWKEAEIKYQILKDV